jgi:hypothetical protein
MRIPFKAEPCSLRYDDVSLIHTLGVASAIVSQPPPPSPLCRAMLSASDVDGDWP